ncbi:MAG: hypothetical protein MHM6MM_000130 [Cercozoa sp. M6MM]
MPEKRSLDRGSGSDAKRRRVKGQEYLHGYRGVSNRKKDKVEYTLAKASFQDRSDAPTLREEVCWDEEEVEDVDFDADVEMFDKGYSVLVMPLSFLSATSPAIHQTAWLRAVCDVMLPLCGSLKSVLRGKSTDEKVQYLMDKCLADSVLCDLKDDVVLSLLQKRLNVTLDDGQLSRMRHCRRDHMRALFKSVRVSRSVRTLLHTLRQSGWRLVFLSHCDKEEAMIELEGLKLASYSHAVVTGTDTVSETAWPFTGMYAECAERTRNLKEHIIVLARHAHHAAESVAAGLPCIFCPRGLSDRQVSFHRPVKQVSSNISAATTEIAEFLSDKEVIKEFFGAAVSPLRAGASGWRIDQFGCTRPVRVLHIESAGGGLKEQVLCEVDRRVLRQHWPEQVSDRSSKRAATEKLSADCLFTVR